jgi:hypothetical protein
VRCVAEYADAEAVNAAKNAAPEICMLSLFQSYRIAPKTLRAEKRVMNHPLGIPNLNGMLPLVAEELSKLTGPNDISRRQKWNGKWSKRVTAIE